jgi:hypothetical protein
VPTAEPWTPPDPREGINNPTANSTLDDIDDGLPDGNRYQAMCCWRPAIPS